ncbi:hypothetical protein BDN70DRAFT_688847 [Pholiota conissans]|uniref:Uncharacterized protein n=1 Tax=Pholiota conissans TaxID=109636 RepID=A0A9P5Z1N0_9AGAR|nr:hypothetical protein BDN70DRAFT_688847 [Pholiota conissans]
MGTRLSLSHQTCARVSTPQGVEFQASISMPELLCTVDLGPLPLTMLQFLVEHCTSSTYPQYTNLPAPTFTPATCMNHDHKLESILLGYVHSTLLRILSASRPSFHFHPSILVSKLSPPPGRIHTMHRWRNLSINESLPSFLQVPVSIPTSTVTPKLQNHHLHNIK